MIASKQWPVGGHITIALASVGFEVATLTPRGSPVRFVKAAKKHFNYHAFFPQSSITRAIAAWLPDLLICADDRALRQLHRLYQRASKSPNSIELAHLVKKSLGDPSGFKTATTATDLLLLTQAEKLRCPRTIVVCNNSEIEGALRDAEYPILVKADGYTGGGGLRLITNQNDAPSAIGEILLSIDRPPRRLKRLAASFYYSNVLKRLEGWPRRVCVQEFVSGKPANRAVLCWNGRVLAGISVEAIATINPFGAASVVRIIDHPEMETTAAVLIERLGLSGFVGFDFMLDEDRNAFLLELNPRVTPIAHLPTSTGDLVAALSKQMMKVVRPNRPISQKEVSLFPQEIGRDKGSPYLSSNHHDVPWNEPAFVAACLTELADRTEPGV
jgi:ATP-grasp domain